MNKARQILDYFRENPTASGKEVSEALGVSQPYVSTVRQRAGMVRVRKGVPDVNVKAAFQAQPKTLDWLLTTKPEGVGLGVYMVAILTDVMNEEMEQ